MTSADLFAALRKEFELADLEWRAIHAGTGNNGDYVVVAPYVNRHALINRLNQVCGIGGWQSDARVSGGHVYVGVGIRVPGDDLQESEWVWRWDGTGFLAAEPPHFTASDAGKGDFSNGFKRACELFGIALYLREAGRLYGIVNSGGRYKANKKGGGEVRWDPPGSLKGTPSYPGEIPGYSAEEGSPPTSASSSEPGETPPPARAEKEKPPTQEQVLERIAQSREQLRSWMEQKRYKVYHLEAVLQTHEKLRMRVDTADKLGRIGTLEDWGVLLSTTERSHRRWEDAPKELAKEYPASPDDLQRLDQLMDQVQLDGSERVQIEEAKAVGWNDAILYWIEKLGGRT